jgi:ATP-dependent Clp protease ATP-binding subunit ClpC
MTALACRVLSVIAVTAASLIGCTLWRMDLTARQAVSYALEAAQDRGAPAIDTEHLLLGVARADPELLQRVAKASGFEESALAHRVEELSPRKAKRADAGSSLPLTARANDAMELTRIRMFGELTSADLLLALLKGEGVAAQVLKELGVTERVVQEARHGRDADRGE